MNEGHLTIYGASDDLIEVVGNVSAEFGAYGDEARFVACSDGTIVRVTYTEDGCWECRVVHLGAGTEQSVVPHDNDRTSYTDKLTLMRETPFLWVALASEVSP